MPGSRIITTDFEVFGKRLKEAPADWEARMLRVGKQAGKYALFLYRRTVTHWTNPPNFSHKVSLSGDILSVDVEHNSDLYEMIDETGARPHMIYPKGPWPLKFQSGYSPKTRIGKFVSMRGRSFGPVIRAAAVHHPGFKARKFTEEIQNRVPVRAIENMEREIEGLDRRVF